MASDGELHIAGDGEQWILTASATLSVLISTEW